MNTTKNLLVVIMVMLVVGVMLMEGGREPRG